MIVPLLSTAPRVFVTLPFIIELVETFNLAFELLRVTASPEAPVNLTSERVRFVAFVRLKPALPFKSTVDIFVPDTLPEIVKFPALVSPRADDRV